MYLLHSFSIQPKDLQNYSYKWHTVHTWSKLESELGS